MKTVCPKNMCVGCYACVARCPKNAISIVDNMDSLNAVINSDCINCGSCYKVCQNNNRIIGQKPISWIQGWSADTNTRFNCASGGIATEITKAFIEKGGIVYTCWFCNDDFRVSRIDNKVATGKLSGSKYVKSNPKGIYSGVKSDLSDGKNVLVIALPCQIAGLKAYLNGKFDNLLYTVDIICHGTPSIKLLDKYIIQYGIKLKECDDISFRTKESASLLNMKYKALIQEGVTDCYSIGFQHGLIYTENCYHCNYAAVERVSDITLGDSWGSDLSQTDKEKGISLVLCQTEKGKQLIEIDTIEKHQVDLDNAIRMNEQLNHPVVQPSNRELFFQQIKNGAQFNKAIRKALPSAYYRQIIKRILITFHILRPKGIMYQITYKEKSRM